MIHKLEESLDLRFAGIVFPLLLLGGKGGGGTGRATPIVRDGYLLAAFTRVQGSKYYHSACFERYGYVHNAVHGTKTIVPPRP